MKYSSYQLGLTASAGSLALLIGAWIFQAIGYAPCAMCIWQRYPHGIAVGIGIIILIGLRHRLIYLLGGLAAAVTSGIGLFHTGVERDWWEGPISCTGTGLDLSEMSVENLLSTSGTSDLVMCDQVVWDLLTLSMASWNAVFSMMLAAMWIVAAARSSAVQVYPDNT